MQRTEKVVITGSSGFIGTHLRKVLESRSPGLEIIGIDKKDAPQSHKADNNNEHSMAKFHKIDLSIRPPDISLGDADRVFHLAANPEVRLGSTDTSLDYENNVVATRNLLESLSTSKFLGTLVFASTSTVYGEATIIPTPETYGPLIPISMYGASKLACESLISAYANLFHFNAKIIRFANVVGGESKHGVIFDFANKLEANPRKLEILGDGTQAKSYVYIGDCVNGLITSASVGDGVDIFNLGTEQTTNVLDIARIVAEEKGLKSVTFEAGYGDGDHGRGWPGDVKRMLLDCNKLIRLGWKYRYTSDEAVRRAAREIESLKNSSN